MLQNVNRTLIGAGKCVLLTKKKVSCLFFYAIQKHFYTKNVNITYQCWWFLSVNFASYHEFTVTREVGVLHKIYQVPNLMNEIHQGQKSFLTVASLHTRRTIVKCSLFFFLFVCFVCWWVQPFCKLMLTNMTWNSPHVPR